MNITELRDWATATFGSHSHREGQIHAALQPLEEWLGHLARHGVMLELVPKDLEAPVPEAREEPAPETPVAQVPAPDLGGFVNHEPEIQDDP